MLRKLSGRSMGRLPCASRQALAIPAAAPTHPGLEGSCDPITSNLYDAAQEDEVPDTAIKASLGSRLPHPLPTRRLDPTGVGPYVLVGHSYAGLVVRLYASTYPEDVCGLILVDALAEGLRDAETPKQWVIQRKLIEGDVRESLLLYPPLERIDIDRSFDQARAAPPLRSLPLVVLSADRPWGPQIPSMIAAGKLPSDVPPDFGYVTDAAQKKAQERLAKLVPNAKHITNANSGHDIHKEQPQLVIEAIREVVEAVRGGRRQLTR
jgi:hypothetical protein